MSPGVRAKQDRLARTQAQKRHMSPGVRAKQDRLCLQASGRSKIGWRGPKLRNDMSEIDEGYAARTGRWRKEPAGCVNNWAGIKEASDEGRLGWIDRLVIEDGGNGGGPCWAGTGQDMADGGCGPVSMKDPRQVMTGLAGATGPREEEQLT